MEGDIIVDCKVQIHLESTVGSQNKSKELDEIASFHKLKWHKIHKKESKTLPVRIEFICLISSISSIHTKHIASLNSLLQMKDLLLVYAIIELQFSFQL